MENKKAAPVCKTGAAERRMGQMRWNRPHMAKWGFIARIIGSILGTVCGCSAAAFLYLWLHGLP